MIPKPPPHTRQDATIEACPGPADKGGQPGSVSGTPAGLSGLAQTDLYRKPPDCRDHSVA